MTSNKSSNESWDSLYQDENEIESPKWHGDILEERRKKIETGKAKFISLDEIRQKE